MPATIDIDDASGSDDLPPRAQMRLWVEAALAHLQPDAEVCVQIVGEDEMTRLNGIFRHRQEPTNVLSFPANVPSFIGIPLLGDIVVCAPVVAREARDQHKTRDAHWAHMLVHGTLHLLGYDHGDDTEAQQMESLETAVITALGFPPPYAGDDPDTTPKRESLQ